MNVFTAIGRVGRDAELKYTQGGDAILRFSVAVDSGYGEKKTTVWLDCAMFGKRGEKLVEYVKKGDRIGVTGELGVREHEGKTYVQLRLNDLTLLGEKKAVDSPRSERPAPARSNDEEFSDSIPF